MDWTADSSSPPALPPDPPLLDPARPSPSAGSPKFRALFLLPPKFHYVSLSWGVFSLMLVMFLRVGALQYAYSGSQAHLVKPWRLRQSGPPGLAQDVPENSTRACLLLRLARPQQTTCIPREDHPPRNARHFGAPPTLQGRARPSLAATDLGSKPIQFLTHFNRDQLWPQPTKSKEQKTDK